MQTSPRCATDGILIKDAATITQAAWQNWNLIPVGGEQLPEQLQKLADQLIAAGFTTLGSLRLGGAEAVAAVTGIALKPYRRRKKDPKNLQAMQKPVVIEDPACPSGSSRMHEVHRTRNLIALLVATPSVMNGTYIGVQLAAFPVILTRRSMRTGRPSCADEVVLTRTIVTAASQTVRGLPGAATFALADGGATAGETTGVRFSDLDDTSEPTQVTLAGSIRLIWEDPRGTTGAAPEDPAFGHPRGRRQLRLARIGYLDPWGRDILTRHVAARRRHGEVRPEDLVTYRGRHEPGGPQATMSAQGVIDKFLQQAGLYWQADVTAKSVTLARAAAAAASGDRQGALAATGETEHRAKRLLGGDLPPATVAVRPTPRYRRAG